MRHERPQPGRPTPIEPLNAELLKAELARSGTAPRARGLLPDHLPAGDVRDVVLADMVELLDQAHLERGFAEIYDLRRAGYPDELCSSLGPAAAKELAKRAAARQGAFDGDDMEAA